MRDRATGTTHAISRRMVVGTVLYVVAALAIDLLSTYSVMWPLSWSMFRWVLGDLFPALDNSVLERFDLFKFLVWLVVPIAICLPRMDWRYLLRARWTRWEVAFVAGLAILGMGAMFIIPLVPELRAFYPSLGHWSPEARIHFFLVRLVWTASWLLGWEFMHRYFLLRAVQPEPPDWSRWRDPRQWGWLLVPLLETAYHLQKASLEAAGMLLFSVVLTLWCLKRDNWLVAFLTHFVIEVELLLFMTLMA